MVVIARNRYCLDGQRIARPSHHFACCGNNVGYADVIHALAPEVTAIVPPAWGTWRRGIQIDIARVSALPRGFAATVHNHTRAFDRPCEMHQKPDRADVQPGLMEDSGSFPYSRSAQNVVDMAECGVAWQSDLDEFEFAIEGVNDALEPFLVPLLIPHRMSGGHPAALDRDATASPEG